MNKTTWADWTVNPFRVEEIATGKIGWGCTKVSAGCANCYAETLNNRFGTRLPFTKESEAKFRFVLDEKALRSIITSRAKPGSRVFPCDMTDLFHPMIPFEFVDHLWAAMALRPDLIFMVLTKRPGRMLEYFIGAGSVWGRIAHRAIYMHQDCTGEDRPDWLVLQLKKNLYESNNLPNVQLFVSVENQATADERIPLLLQCPAAVRGVSYEPALGPVDFAPWLRPVHADAIDAPWRRERIPALTMGKSSFAAADETPWLDGLDGVIAGGETGPGARPANPEWFRKVRNACAAARVAFFLKQLGGNLSNKGGRVLDGLVHDNLPGGGK